MFLINGCYLSFWSDRWLTDGNNSIGATHNRSEKTCTKSVGRNILRWNVEAEQIGGIHIATKVHSIAWKAYWNLQRKVLAYIALNTWWKLKKKGRNVVSRVSEPTYKRQNVITPRKPPPPPTMIVAWILRILVRNFCMMCKIRGKLRGNESEKRAVGTARNREYAVKTIRNDSNMHKKS